MLASGAHVKIGTEEFRLKRGQGSYSYALIPIEENVQYWLWDDWSGGEGADAYLTEDPIVYHQGNVNPRLPGKLLNPPDRQFISNTPTEAPDRALMASAGGYLFLTGATVATTGDSEISYTDDPTGSLSRLQFTGTTSFNNPSTTDRITAIATDGSQVFVFGHNNGVASECQRIEASGGTPSISTKKLWNYDDTRSNPVIGAAVLGSRLYGWLGHRLLYWPIDDEANDPQNDTLAYTSGGSLNGTWETDYWGDMVAGDTSLYMYYAVDGKTVVYEWDGRSGTPIWNMPDGFTGKAITYSNGALLLVGDYNGKAALFGMSVVSRQPLFLGYIREQSDALQLEVMGNGFGAEILMAEKDGSSSGGQVFIYDMNMDAISQVGNITLASSEIWSLGTFKGKRVMGVENGTLHRLYTFDLDENPSTTIAGRMETGAWDMDLPEDQKTLEGIHILADFSAATAAVDVYYQDDEDGTWTQAGAELTSGFHNYIEVSNATSDVTFRSLRLRVDPKGAAEVFAVSARYRVTTYLEVWELVLDLTNEGRSRWDRKRSTSDKAWQLRDYIRDIADNSATVEFLDGARYPGGRSNDPDKYSTHQVKLSIPVDNIENVDTGEGTMVVRLVSTDTN